VDAGLDFKSEGLSITNNRFFRHPPRVPQPAGSGNDGNLRTADLSEKPAAVRFAGWLEAAESRHAGRKCGLIGISAGTGT
jgi:hypothetical protein